MNDLKHITYKLGIAYKRWKEFESEKNEFKNEFFSYLDENVGKSEPFTFINPTDGMVYSRSQVSGPISLDDDKIRETNPELWGKITRQVTEIIPLEELDPAIIEELKPYVSQGPPTTKLTPPRPAKPEELEEL